MDGAAKVFTVQYFERAIFEAHPENQRPFDVLLSLVGGEKYRAKYPNSPGGGPAPSGTPRPAPGVFPRSARSQAVAVTIHAIQDNVPGDQYFAPQAGYRWVAIDASVQNITTRNLSYNALYGKLQTVDNREWAQPLGGKNPDFSYGTQQPNETNRGWFTFEVAIGAEVANFAYDPTFGSAPLRIPLR